MDVNLDGNTITNGYFSGVGEELIELDADHITSGTLSDDRLSVDVALTDRANTFTQSQGIPALSNLTTNGLVKTTGGDGTLSVDTASYLTSADIGTTVQGYNANTTTLGNTVSGSSGTLLETNGDGSSLSGMAGTPLSYTFSTSNTQTATNGNTRLQIIKASLTSSSITGTLKLVNGSKAGDMLFISVTASSGISTSYLNLASSAGTTFASISWTTTGFFPIYWSGSAWTATNSTPVILFAGTGISLTTFIDPLAFSAVNYTVGLNLAVDTWTAKQTFSASLSTAGVGYSTTAVSTSATTASNQTYISTGTSLVTFTLHITPSVGDTVTIIGNGSGGWKIAQTSATKIVQNASVTTTGTGGSIASTNANNCVTLMCTIGGLTRTWTVVNSQGTFTFV